MEHSLSDTLSFVALQDSLEEFKDAWERLYPSLKWCSTWELYAFATRALEVATNGNGRSRDPGDVTAEEWDFNFCALLIEELAPSDSTESTKRKACRLLTQTVRTHLTKYVCRC